MRNDSNHDPRLRRRFNVSFNIDVSLLVRESGVNSRAATISRVLAIDVSITGVKMRAS